MKTIERDILQFQEKDFFFPVRNKIHYAKILVLAARKLLLGPDIKSKGETSSMKLVVGNISRLFFYKDNKYFSIAFPFTTAANDQIVTEITTYSGRIIDFKSISAVISILNNEQFILNPSLIDFFIEPTGIESDGILLLEEIFLFEPSYMRYDYDPSQENGKYHPLHHLDINYSQYSTFKIGFSKSITRNYFEDIHDTDTECSYISQ